MTASETPITNDSKAQSTLISTTSDSPVDSEAVCDGRAEDPIPQTPPPSDPQRMEKELQVEADQTGEALSSEATEESPATGSAPETDSDAQTAS